MIAHLAFARPAPARPSPSPVAPTPADDELSWAELMDLFTPEEPDAGDLVSRPPFGGLGTELRVLMQPWTRRAAAWSAVRLGGSRRAW